MNPELPSIPVEVLPPIPKLAQTQPASDAPTPDGVTRIAPETESWPLNAKTFFHPVSGAIILGIDFLGFGSEFLSAFLDTPIICVLSFLVTFVAVLSIQVKYRGDSGLVATGKALIGGILAGMPMFIGGTMLGVAVITLSGLPENKVTQARQLAEHLEKRSRDSR